MNMRVVVDMVVLEMKMTMIEFVETFDILERKNLVGASRNNAMTV